MSDEIKENEISTISESETENLEDSSWWSRYMVRRAIKKEEKRRKEEAKSLFQNICELVAFTAIALLVALIIKNFIGQPIIVDGDSMNDTLSNHDLVWANKLGYVPERYDVVIIEPYEGQKTLYIKRIIALPGETIFVDGEDKIHITPPDSTEGYILDDPYGYFSGVVFSRAILNPNNEDGSYTLGEDEYFCIGDNRYNSKDSRALGSFSSDQIKGHAVIRLWPLTKFGDFDKSNERG